MSKNLERFVFDYIEKIEDIVVFSKSEVFEDILIAVEKERKRINELLFENGIDKKIHEIEQDKIINILKKDKINKILPKDLGSFVSTMFYSESTLTNKELITYQKTIENFELTKDVSHIYQLAFIEKENITENEITNDFKTTLNSIFKNLKVKDKAEFVSNINIFLENYMETDFGSKKIELINKKYKEAINSGKDSKEICKDWFQDLIDVVNSNTPKNINLVYDKETNDLKASTETGGLFDGWYIINQTKYAELSLEEKKKFDNAKTEAELNDLEDSRSIKKQLQISTTTDRGLAIEGDSIVRHSLANAVISTVLNEYLEIQNDSSFIDSFSKQVLGFEGNSTMRGAIIASFKSVLGNDFFEGLDLEDNNGVGSKKAIEMIQKKTTKHPVYYIKKLLKRKKDLLPEHVEELLKKEELSTTLSEEEMDSFLNLKNLNSMNGEDNGNWVFEPLSNVSLFYNNRVTSDIKDAMFEEKDLTASEQAMLIQYSALLKMKVTRDIEMIDLSALNKFTKGHIRLKASSPSEKYNNDFISSLTIEEIDENILNTFVFSEHAEENSRNLNQSTKDVLSKIISSTLKNEKYLEEINVNKISFSKKIGEMIKITKPSCFSNKFIEDIMTTQENIAYKNEKTWNDFTKKVRRNQELNDFEKDILLETRNYLELNNLKIAEEYYEDIEEKDFINILENAISIKNERIQEFKKGYNIENPLLEEDFDYSQDQEGNPFLLKTDQQKKKKKPKYR